MKFTDSPVIDLPIGNKLLSFQQDNASMHVGTSVWPCSLVLSKFVDRWRNSSTENPYSSVLNFSGGRGIEIGAGCGVSGMAFYLLGLTNIIVTDIAPVMPALKHNLKRNKQTLGKMLKTSILYWNNKDQIKALNPPFDFVIATDVVYIKETVKDLVTVMDELVAENGVVLLGYQVRCPDADLLFWEMCSVVFVIEKVKHEDLHPDHNYEETDVYILRKKKKDIVSGDNPHGLVVFCAETDLRKIGDRTNHSGVRFCRLIMPTTVGQTIYCHVGVFDLLCNVW